MIFPKLTVLALLGLQSASVLAREHLRVKFICSFPDHHDGRELSLQNGVDTAMTFEWTNEDNAAFKLFQLSGKLSSENGEADHWFSAIEYNEYVSPNWSNNVLYTFKPNYDAVGPIKLTVEAVFFDVDNTMHEIEVFKETITLE